MSLPLLSLALAAVLTLVPVTLLVPGLSELVIVAHGGTRFHAHLFMTVNMVAGMLAVPVVMMRLRGKGHLARWLVALLLADAALFAAMGQARSLTWLFVFRALDGAAHLPAVTLLMVAANRLGGERRGAALGLIAGSVMVGVAIGAPLGGVLVGRSPATVYYAGAAIVLVAALVALAPARRAPVAPPREPGSRYRWDHRAPHSWMPLMLGFQDRFTIGVFVSTFTLYLAEVVRLSPAERGMLMSLFMLPFAALCYPVGRLSDRSRWLLPLAIGNLGFGAAYACYGLLPAWMLAPAMVASGVLSALMYAPNLVLVGEMARHGAGEGLFGGFQVAGSIGFLTGPLVGGLLVELSKRLTGEVAYAAIFAVVGASVMVVGAVAVLTLRPLAREWKAQGAG
ncbi:MAG TPA: MFS transporter [Gemmatimonadales bacterium]|nr:MFS transporter [Gemmatimonadales bacterium]